MKEKVILLQIIIIVCLTTIIILDKEKSSIPQWDVAKNSNNDLAIRNYRTTDVAVERRLGNLRSRAQLLRENQLRTVRENYQELFDKTGFEDGLKNVIEMNRFQTELTYLPFFEQLGIEGKDREELLDYVTAAMSSSFDGIMQSGASGSSTFESFQNIRKEIEEQKQTFETMLEGKGYLEEYRKFEEEREVRELVERFSGQVAGLDMAIDSTKMDDLVSLLVEGEKIDEEMGSSNDSELFGTDVAMEEISKILDHGQYEIFQRFVNTRESNRKLIGRLNLQ